MRPKHPDRNHGPSTIPVVSQKTTGDGSIDEPQNKAKTVKSRRARTRANWATEGIDESFATATVTIPGVPAFIYGIHEIGGEDLMLQAGRGGWVLELAKVGHQPQSVPSADYTDLSNRGLGVVVRLNHGYGSTGTIPLPNLYDAFADACAAFVGRTKGCRIWIVGNEPNHASERPDGQFIFPRQYADAYKRCRRAIRGVHGHEQDLVLVAGPAPWNAETKYQENPSGDWVRYFADTLAELSASECDGFALHTYTHYLNTGQIKDEFFHGADGYRHLHNEFQSYRDFMQAIPERFRRLPVLITETDPTEPGVGWQSGQNIGWVTAAYDEIARWNMDARNQPIQALILYRWPRAADQPEWSIVDRPGIQDDFRAALRANPPSRYQVRLPSQAPALETPTDLSDVSLPSAFTNQHVIDAFHDAAAALGLANRWLLLKKVEGLSLAELAKDRQGFYTGPSLAQLPRLTEQERRLVHRKLVEAIRRAPVAGVSFGLEPASQGGFLRNRIELHHIQLAPPSDLWISPVDARTVAERRISRMWNRCGWCLLRVADVLGIDPGLAVAIVAAERIHAGINPDGRMRVRFENHVFFQKWGANNPGGFAEHFQFDPRFPWQMHLWHSDPEMPWQDPHRSQDEEWRAFECARRLDDTAAKLSLAMGGPGIMGLSYAAIGHMSVDQMFIDFSAGEGDQLVAFFDLLAGPAGGSRKLAALRKGDLDLFAALHRSPQQVARYDCELRSALEAFRRLAPAL
jgi:hypothetical protein